MTIGLHDKVQLSRARLFLKLKEATTLKAFPSQNKKVTSPLLKDIHEFIAPCFGTNQIISKNKYVMLQTENKSNDRVNEYVMLRKYSKTNVYSFQISDYSHSKIFTNTVIFTQQTIVRETVIQLDVCNNRTKSFSTYWRTTHTSLIMSAMSTSQPASTRTAGGSMYYIKCKP